ncbi:MAG: SUMF1/EgtB/PvdO family nonheme iron enzyme [Acidobacteriota bacterium]
MTVNPRVELDTIRVSDIYLREAPAPGFFDLQFGLSWGGSWRFDPTRRGGNWDAAWVFVKFQRRPVVKASPELDEALSGGDPLQVTSRLREQGLDFDQPLRATPIEEGWLVRSSILQKPQQPGVQTESQDITIKVLRCTDETATDETTTDATRITRRSFDWTQAMIEQVVNCPKGAVVVPGDGRLGVFVHRNSKNLGLGPVKFKDIDLRLHLTDGSTPQVEDLSVAVFALNMVYIPEGPFWAGDYRGQVDQAFFDSCSLNDPEGTWAYQVDSEAQIEVGDADGDCPEGEKLLYYRSNPPLRAGGDQCGPIPEAFPKGFQAFYVMKSHVTQGEYADFVNYLPTTAKTQRYPYEEGAYRYTIARDRSMRRIARRPLRACNFLAWADGIAFAAWACLRPLSELEFEKACRGPLLPVTREYAWGNTELVPAQIIVGPGTTEVAVSGNCNVDNTFILFNGGDGASGPVRDNSLIISGSPDVETQVPIEEGFDLRTATGASYYGVLGMSGNLWEQCVTVGNPQGRAFTGKNGTGQLSLAGSAPARELSWPNDIGIGAGFRGGTWFTDSLKARLADRTYAAGLRGYFFRSLDTGFRCATTAPADDE